jgi:hypothetical protein
MLRNCPSVKLYLVKLVHSLQDSHIFYLLGFEVGVYFDERASYTA